MKEYICSNCKTPFDDLAIKQGDVSWYQGMPVREEIQVCPVCKSTEFYKISEIMNKIEAVLNYYDLDWYDLSDLMEEKI